MGIISLQLFCVLQNVISKKIQANYLDLIHCKMPYKIFLIELLGEWLSTRGLKYENNNTEILLHLKVKSNFTLEEA